MSMSEIEVLKIEDIISFNRGRKIKPNSVLVDSYKNAMDLYSKFIDNKFSSYETFRNEITNNSKRDLYNVYTRINNIYNNISPYKANQMKKILEFQNAQKEYDVEKMNELFPVINNITKDLDGELTNISEKKLDLYETIKIVKSVNKIVKSEKSVNELAKQKLICSMKELLENVNYILRDTKEDMYVTFLLKVFELNKVDNKELDQMVEVLTYFVKNIQINIDKITEYYEKSDRKKLREILPEYNYNDNRSGTCLSLYRKKLIPLKKDLMRYSILLNMLKEFKEKQDFKVISLINEEKVVSEDFINDFYKNLVKIRNVKDRKIDKLVNISKEKKNSFNEEYKKQLILK